MTPFTQETEKLLYRLIDNANVLVLYFDVDGRVGICNKRIEQFSAKKREGLIGENWFNLLFHGQGQAMKQQMFKALMDDSITYKRPNNFEGLILDKDNNERLISWSITPILTESKDLEGILLIGNDITEFRERLEYQISQAEKLAALGQLAAGMAHEINNPLFVISGRLEMLLEQKTMPQELKEDLGIISTQADRIKKLIDRMLKFSRQTTPKFEAININDTIEGALPLLSYHKLADAKIEMLKDFAKDLPSIKGDLNQLQEVFINLFLNAHQAMPQGGKLTVKTSNLQNQYAEIRVSDTGCGIPLQNLKNIFMPFFSTKKGGTGLGLSICYNIIKNHNGSIDIESQVNKGTTFIIKLPGGKDVLQSFSS